MTTARSTSAPARGRWSESRRPWTGEQYAGWLRSLVGQSGIYEIYSTSGRLLYVGESHTGKLYQTITRHFQSWSGPTAGKTYDRDAVRVRVKVTRAALAIPAQNARICQAEPDDNVLAPACEREGGASDVPF